MPTTNGANGTTHSWSSLPNAMEKWWQAFVDTKAIIEPVTFGVQSVGGNDAVIVNVSPGAKTNVTTGNPSKADFTLSAKPEQWEKFFDKDPKAPYTSFVGLQGMNIVQDGIGVQGDQVKFAQYGHLANKAYGIFHSDLDFYFGGFDARHRVNQIDCKICPVYFLMGEYDWSTTPEMSQATAKKIKGANFESMAGLGHFPATENPARFVPYLLRAIEWIQKTRAG